MSAQHEPAPQSGDAPRDIVPAKHKPAKKTDESDAGAAQGLPTYVTDLASIEQQVGAHVIRALAHDEAVAVLSLVQAGPSGQRIASIPLDEEMLEQVQEIVFASQEKEATAGAAEVPCVGFHCYLPANLAKNRAKDKKKE